MCACAALLQRYAQAVFKEISSLHMVFSTNPIFGVEFTVEDPVRGDCLVPHTRVLPGARHFSSPVASHADVMHG